MRNNQLTYFTATELVEVIAKWSANPVISLIIANKIKKIIKFYKECRTCVEKESASNALATLAIMVPELNRIIREDDALCQCFQNDFLNPISNKLRLNLVRIKCHIYINTCLTYTNSENSAALLKSESFCKFNEIVSKLENLLSTHPQSCVLRDFLRTFSHQIHQNILTWARNKNASTIIVEDYVLLMLTKFLNSINSNMKKCYIPTYQKISDGNTAERTAEMEDFLSSKIFEKYFDDNRDANVTKKVKNCTIGVPQSVENHGLDDLFALEKIFPNKIEAKVISKGLVVPTAIGNILKRIDSADLTNFLNY
jgi:hypothetical protein